MDFASALANAINGAIGIVKKIVPDKDKQNEIIGAIENVKQVAYMAELNTKTVPWVDALHKMGRLITNWSLIITVVVFELMGWELSQNIVFLMGGGNIVYQLIKGKGR